MFTLNTEFQLHMMMIAHVNKTYNEDAPNFFCQIDVVQRL